ncbi:hypothetical protein GCM10027429_06760 [Marivirga atlantica]|jgi:hypothetical protein|uniref:Bacterial surface antigen (D15) domain-containing protein n=1 Tax=Marivirga atlantica TaxID=1548457 RepID=A0A937DIK9_9BACT|nr:hypothetical protein [Marivirga atlantica]MBL0764286.1 hypothetical protein [Marivirga atlantica]
MEITIVTGLLTKWNMNVNTAHLRAKVVYIFILMLTKVLTISSAQVSEESKSLVLPANHQFVIDSLKSRGFLEARYGEIDGVPSVIKGPTYYWNEVSLKFDKEPVVRKGLINVEGEIADQILLKDITKGILKKYAYNQGYPFAEAVLDIDKINGYTVDATVHIKLRNLILYDSIEANNDLIKTKYLQNYLDLHYHGRWSMQEFNGIQDKISQIEFLALSEVPRVNFSNGKAQINLDINKVPSNRFDAIIGVIPVDNRTLITGQADFALTNLFRSAIKWQLNWQKYDEQSQFLNTSIAQFRSFSSPLGFETHFNLLKEDSTFLNLSYDILLNYPLKYNLFVKAGYARQNSSVTFSLNDLNELPTTPLRSSQTNSLVLGITYKTPLAAPKLKSNHYAGADISIGSKNIINYENLPESWRNVPKRTSNIKVGLKAGFQQKLGKRFVIEETFSSETIINEALATNDYLRLGGLQDLRGFNQNFFFTQHYSLLNLNYRYFLNNKSSAFGLTDFAYLNKDDRFVYSFGLGVDARTNSGWFRLIYALGIESGQKANISSAKVHFGYIALF